ncbi:FAD-binding and (Fe-S)-binding domain-containing protein [Nocardia veterana]|uniref:FAD-binding oxidoreductase n=1 Tax=Nocardia veterana TaxID=132249 RepID=A0A7X6LWW8_9NOCA|nr:FAD-binding and (Fe-S)-binding domain-containing protein [Nocardia veterana]NKY85392.1 FAD-binding oxidoreductase [Nocardia veterana]
MTDSWVRALRDRIDGEVDADDRRRAEYSSDASNYRVVPAAVVYPRGDDDVARALWAAREEGLPVTARGGGTSVAGNAIGSGLILDFSRHMNGVLAMDPEQRCARVQPGLVLSELQRVAGRHGLRLGPDPSTQNRCTLGGMLGNNACGPRAVAWGRTSDTVHELRILDGTGSERRLGSDLSALPGLPEFTRRHLATLRTELGRFERQASGYGLHYLTPERGSSIARAFVGSEGTCGLILDATVELVPVPRATAVAVLGYPDMPTAADDVKAVMAGHPIAVEGLDARLVDVVRAHGRAVPELPAGGAWLFVEFAGESTEFARDSAASVARSCGALDSRIVTDPAVAARLWRIRADGAGLAGRTPAGEPAWPGWEDAAVPPERLGDYLRDFDRLMHEYRVDGLLYGHIGDGCIHVRLDLPIADAPQRFRDFLYAATDLVVRHGGSASGEHGDGRARSELLARMYSPAALRVFAEFKTLFDPDDALNPGVLVRPEPVDARLRLAGVGPVPAVGGFAFGADGDIGAAVHRCVGVGKCRADTRAAGGFMCPSYLATADEKDSTRGRARVLQEVVRGALDWRDEAVAQSLDLCLSCRACSSDCPAGVDMATYKSETLYRAYQGRPRPMDHYVLGQLPRWLAVGTRVPRIVNALTGNRRLRSWGMRLAGMDPRRPAPRLAPRSFRRQWASRDRDLHRDGPVAMLWIDSFTDAFAPEIGWAAVELIESAGYRVRIPQRRVCCGLTWISTGQLDGARKRLRAGLEALDEHIRAGGPVIGLEPSCTAVLRSDLIELLPDDPRAAPTARAVRTLAEFLVEQPGWQPPDRSGETVVVQPHCHQHAVLGFDADLALLRRTGATITEINGCCGLAGNFGMQAGHYDISVAVAENGLLPALRSADPETPLLADGFSCRTQAEQLAGRRGLHLARYLTGR